MRGRRSTKAESVLAGIRGKTWSKKAPPKLVNATRVLVALLVLATGAIGATSPRFDPSPAGSMAGQTDADRAAYLVLTVADVGSSWTLAPIAAGGPGTSAGSGPVGRVRGRGVDRLTIDGCLARFHGDTAASSVTYRLRSDTSSHQGYASTGGRTLATTSAAGEMLQAMSSGAQDSCLAASLADYAWNCGCHGGTTSVGKPDLAQSARMHLADGRWVDEVEIHGQVPFTTTAGEWLFQVDLTLLRQGRLVATLAFFRSDGAPGWNDLEQRLLDRTEHKLVSAGG